MGRSSLHAAAAVLLILVALAAPAAAGTADNPEIVDDCGAQVRSNDTTTTVTPGHVDICAGWFETTASGLQVTLRTSGPTSPEPGFWAVWWDHGDCTYELLVDDTLGAEHPQAFRAGCGQAPAPQCQVPGVDLTCTNPDHFRTFRLPAGNVARTGNTVQMRVDFTGALAEFAAAHARGQVLSAPRVWATTAVGPVYAYTFGCSFSDFGTHCLSAGGDHTTDGRDYTVGT